MDKNIKYDWYAISKISSTPSIEREDMGDRIRYYLKSNDKNIGKLTIQDFGYKYYVITYFKIENEYRNQGYGSKMLKMALEDPKFLDKDIVVQPSPFNDEDYEQQVASLKDMYKHFGFVDYEYNYLIYKRNK